MAKKLLGIDIGDYKIKFALYEKGQARNYVEATLPDNLVKDGRITAYHAMADFLKETTKANKLRHKKAVISLPASEYFIRRVRVPRMSVQQLNVNLPYELHDYLTGDIGRYVFDYSILSIGEKDMELIVAACNKETVINYQQMCDKAGLKLIGLTPDVLTLENIVLGEEALKNAIPKDSKELAKTAKEQKKLDKKNKKKKAQEAAKEGEQQEEAELTENAPTATPAPAPAETEAQEAVKLGDFAILDLGHSGTRLHFFEGSHYEITRTLASGAKEIIAMLAQDEGIDPHVARVYAESNHEGCLTKNTRITDELDVLATEIMRVMNFYNYNNPNNTVDTIYYMGSGIPAEVIHDRVTEATGLEFRSITELLPEFARIESIDNAPQTYGAVISPKKSAINLFIVEKHTKQNIIAILLFLVYLGALGLFTKYAIIDQLAIIDRMEQQYYQTEESLKAIQKENEVYSEVRAEYSHYGNGYLNDEERAMQDRMDVLAVIEEQLLSKDALQNIAVTDNVATLTINSEKLSNVSLIVAALENYDIVEFVTVSNSATNDRYQRSGEETEAVNVVTTMTIYFRDADTMEEN